MPQTEPQEHAVMAQELQGVLHEELNRLPEKYRTPMVLCYLGGKTNKEVARALGCPKGTILSRLARGRDRLRGRLMRRGFALSAGGVAVVLSETVASAAIPTSLVTSTIQVAALVAAGKTVVAGAVSPATVALTEGVLKAMFVNKLKSAIVLLLLAVTATGLGVMSCGLQAAGPAKSQEVPAPGPHNDAAPVALQTDRLAAARKAFASIWGWYRHGLKDEEDVYRWSVRVLNAQRAMAKGQGDHVAAFTAHLDRMKELEKEAGERPIALDTTTERLKHGNRQHLLLWKDGKISGAEVPARPANIADVTAYYRAEADLWLAEAKEGEQKRP
jgi:hypothetical protein